MSDFDTDVLREARLQVVGLMGWLIGRTRATAEDLASLLRGAESLNQRLMSVLGESGEATRLWELRLINRRLRAVVRAVDEQSARYSLYLHDNLTDDWLDQAKSSCIPLTHDGKTGVVLCDAATHVKEEVL